MIASPSTTWSDRRAKLPRHFDWWLLSSAVVLLCVGLMSLFSVDSAQTNATHFRKQILHVAIGIAPLLVMYFVEPHFWRRFAKPLYYINLALLAFVLFKGHSAGGSQRWIQLGQFGFQPSELAKLLTTLTLASFFCSRQGQIEKFSTFALSFLHVLVPLLLIFTQPHLGATLVVIIAWLSISLAAGVPLKYLIGTFVLVLFALAIAIRIPGVLHSYQRERVKAMFNANQRGNAYQAMRAQIAFGVGGVTGAGYLHGTQKQLRYIPAQHTDFIFTVIGEEGGLIGCTLVLIAYFVLLYRIWLLTVTGQEPFFRGVAAGILGILAFHTIANLGMNLQLLPVVGLWLPFMSYGGSAMWLCMAAVGLLLNMKGREKPVLF